MSNTQPNLNHYRVLGLRPPTRPGEIEYSTEKLKAVYRSALLQNHPDKDLKEGQDTIDINQSSQSRTRYSIDQIIQAYECLIDPTSRTRYEREYLEARNKPVPKSDGSGRITGLEQFDLEDLEYDDSSASWSKVCRCGGCYKVRDIELEASANDGEVTIPCSNCSLFIKIAFAVLD